MTQHPERDPKRPRRRLVIGFSHQMECRTALDFATYVAGAVEVELMGVFVEDQELLDLARLPFSIEFLAASKQTRNLDAGNMGNELRAIAGDMQKALQKLAERAKRPYSFRITHGRMLPQLTALAHADDLILLRTACVAWRQAAVAPTPNGPVVVLAVSESGNDDLLRLARAIAHEINQQVILVADYIGAESLRALRPRLVIASTSMFASDVRAAEIERLINVMDCPVLIVPSTTA